jgi:hypothetical protein
LADPALPIVRRDSDILRKPIQAWTTGLPGLPRTSVCTVHNVARAHPAAPNPASFDRVFAGTVHAVFAIGSGRDLHLRSARSAVGAVASNDLTVLKINLRLVNNHTNGRGARHAGLDALNVQVAKC